MSTENSAGQGPDLATVRSPQRVTVGVLTYRRTESLAPLLPVLVEHAHDAVAAAGGPAARTVRILVVDNDAAGSARETVANAAARAAEHPEGAIEIVGVVEEAPGISAARNRALDECAQDDLLVFIDDDETPDEGWLRTILAAHARFDCAAIAGPVRHSFEGEPDPFLTGGRFFDLTRYETGEEIEESGSGNLLLDLPRLRRHGIRFDPEYGITGGEDTKLCRDIRDAGERIVWCDEAVCHEPVVAGRATPSFARRKALRQGTLWARLRLRDAESDRRRAALRAGYLARGGAKAARGGVQAGLARARGDRSGVGAGAREAFGGLGIAAAALGIQVEGYSRPTPLSDLDVRTDPSVPRPRPVTVGIPTYRRDEQLRALLAALAPQVAGLVAQGREVRVVVADNDPAAGARGIVADAADVLAVAGVAVEHVHEPRPGVVAVRNTLLDHAVRDGYLACIDDDELPAEGWLEALVETGERTGAAAVAGTHSFRLGEDAEAWVARSGHFDAPRWEADAELVGASTANLLLDLLQLRRAGLRFDEAYSLTGGEDSRLSRDIHLAGGRVVAAPGAVTIENVPVDRATRRWVLSRAERFGESWARVRADVRPGEGAVVPWLRRVPLAGRGVYGMGRSAIALAVARARGDERAVARAEHRLSGTRGIVRGAAGIGRAEYARSAE